MIKHNTPLTLYETKDKAKQFQGFDSESDEENSADLCEFQVAGSPIG